MKQRKGTANLIRVTINKSKQWTAERLRKAQLRDSDIGHIPIGRTRRQETTACMGRSIPGESNPKGDVDSVGIFACGERPTGEGLEGHRWEVCYHVVGSTQEVCTTGIRRGTGMGRPSRNDEDAGKGTE